MSKQQHRKQMFRGGVVMLTLGAMFGIAGFVSSPAGADVQDHQITVCHAEGNGRFSTPNPNKYQIDAPDGHGSHLDDIIPPFPAGSQGNNAWAAYPGLNWDDAGRAIYDTCAPCAVGTHDELGNCTTPQQDPDPQVCAEGQSGVWPACTTPQQDPDPQVCPRGQVGTPPSCTTPQQDPDPTPPVVAPVVQDTPTVAPEVVQPTQQAAATEVEGLVLVAEPATTPAPAAAALPRTGTETLPLTQLGLGLLLLGAGALIIGRDRTVTI